MATFSPEDVLALQRTSGNRAISQALSQQLARAPVTTDLQFRAHVPVRGPGTLQEQSLGRLEASIARRLRRYNRIATDNTRIPDRVRLLGELDHLIYGWFDELQSTDFDAEPRAPYMRDLMNELDAEHVNVVRAARAGGVVPVYMAGLTPGSQARATRIWQSISSGTGYLQVESGGDAAFEDQTFSSLAKMLHTKMGRDLIRFLDRPPGGGGSPPGVGVLPTHPGWGVPLTGYETFIAPETQALRQAGILGATGTGESSANRPLSQVHGSGAGQTDYTRLAVPPAVLGDYPLVTDATQYNQALLAGRPGFSINTGGGVEYYAFGTGEGNLTIMDYGQFSRGIGAGNVEVVSPKFVMLAHELGHAIRVRGGGYAADEQFGWFGALGPTWQNKAEEMSNVIGVENVIRQQSGITTRSTYNTWKFIHGAPAFNTLMTQFLPIQQRLEAAGFTDLQIWNWANTQPGPKMLYLYGKMTAPSDATARAERTRLKDAVSTPLINLATGAVATFAYDFLLAQVPTRLPPLLRVISGDDTKAGALMAGLTAAEKVQALEYLLTHADLSPVRALLHFGFAARQASTGSAARERARLEALRTLIAPGGTLVAAGTQRTTVAALP